MGSRRDSTILTVLTVAACAIAIGAVQIGRSYPLEAFGFVTGVVCVYLAARENVWNWPLGLLNSSASIFVMFRDRLFADAALYVVYFVSGVLGWYWWTKGGQGKASHFDGQSDPEDHVLEPRPKKKPSEEVVITSTPRKEWPIIAAATVAAMSLVAYWMYSIEGAAPLVDTFVTVMSLVAQYLLTRKYIENWVIWILVDVIYVPLFLWKGLYLYAILFAIFTVIAYFGLREWKAIRDQESGKVVPMPAKALVHTLLGLGVAAALLMTWTCWRFETRVPAQVFAMFKGANPIKANTQPVRPDKVFRSSTPLSDEAIHKFKANALDPLFYVDLGAVEVSKTEFPRGIIRFEQEGVEPITYEVFASRLRVDGRSMGIGPWKRWLEEYFPQ